VSVMLRKTGTARDLSHRYGRELKLQRL